jgi:hypothetical protein
MLNNRDLFANWLLEELSPDQEKIIKNARDMVDKKFGNWTRHIDGKKSGRYLSSAGKKVVAGVAVAGVAGGVGYLLLRRKCKNKYPNDQEKYKGCIKSIGREQIEAEELRINIVREEFNKWYNEVFFAGPELKKVLSSSLAKDNAKRLAVIANKVKGLAGKK